MLQKLRKLGANESGDNAGVTIPRDVLRMEGLMDEDGQLLEQPHFEIDHAEDGRVVLRRVDEPFQDQ
jgi:hypothetical protein